MRIIQLQSENIKRLKAVDITPNKHLNRISGGNGEGKTSLLDSIMLALAGTSKAPKQVVRKGAGKGFVRLQLDGGLVITRRFFEGGSNNGTLALESTENKSRYASPQQLLDGLMGKISFDPLEFIRMKPEKQAEVLRSLVKLEVDVDALDADYQTDYLRRREAKKERDAIQIRRDAFAVPDNLPSEKIDEAALVVELREVSSYNDSIAREQRERDERKGHRNRLASDIAEQRERVVELRAQADELEAEANVWDATLKENDAEIAEWPPLPEPKDAEELAVQITHARGVNFGIDRRRQRDGFDNEIATLDIEIDKLDEAMKERTATKDKAISEAEFPIDGLAFGDGEVIYQGIPFSQASTAEQIRASVAIGMASNPELRVMIIRDASLLDAKSMNLISEMTNEQDFQVYCEVTDTSGKVGIYIEDGTVKTINAEPEPKPTAKPKRKKKEVAHA